MNPNEDDVCGRLETTQMSTSLIIKIADKKDLLKRAPAGSRNRNMRLSKWVFRPS